MVRQRGGEGGIGQLRALFDVVDEVIRSDDFQGCIFVNVAMEFPLSHDPAHIAAAHSKQVMEDLVTEIATRAGAKNPRDLAQELCLVIEGVYVTRQVTGNPETIEIARRIADRIISEHLCSA